MGRRTVVGAAGIVVAAAVLVAVAAWGSLEQLVVIATLLVLVACAAVGWLVAATERRILRAVRDARPTVQEHVRRIEVVQPEAHAEQLLRSIEATRARLEAGQQELAAQLDRLEPSGTADAGDEPVLAEPQGPPVAEPQGPPVAEPDGPSSDTPDPRPGAP